MLSVETRLLYLLGDPVDPRIVWEKLAGQFQRKSWANKLELKRKLFSMKLDKEGVVQDHIKAMTELLDELSIIDVPVKEEDRVVYLLASLPDQYDMLVTALEASADVPKWEVVTERLLHEEKKQKSRSVEKPSVGDEEALAIKYSKPFPSSKGPRCYDCGKMGHIRRNCNESGERYRGAPQDRRRGAYYAEAGRREEVEEERVGLLVGHALAARVSSQGKWIMDSSHMCGDQRLFKELHTLDHDQEVTLGDGHALKATGRGKVTLRMNLPMGKLKCTLSDVLLVPKLAYNLFSVSKATEAGKTTEFGETRVKDGDRLVAQGYKQRGLYYLDHHDEPDQVHITSSNTWHRRFGHLGNQGLAQLEDGRWTGADDDSQLSHKAMCTLSGRKAASDSFP